ncbi:hypothetical protein [Streptomyces nigra]|uniref:Uncharacterized protein n=1 Tax=Streptomyces nigra TaxID=1827580 RepID=A0ABZ1J3S6_9ACTN
MSDLDSQIPYWNSAAATKTFTHPLHSPWLAGIGKHGGVLYVSDLLLQEDKRNRALRPGLLPLRRLRRL